MPTVIKLTKTDLNDFARTAVLANTPLSLLKGLIQCAGMNRLRACPIGDLIEYYDRLTARADRTEIVVGLAYAVLCAVVLHARDAGAVQVDAARLQWGNQIWEFAGRARIGTNLVVSTQSMPRPEIAALTSPSTETRFLYGPDNRPLS